MIEAAYFRSAMARLGAAVNIITTDGPAGRHGMTASAVCSVTDDPPMLLLCVNRTARANAVLRANGRLCVNILSAAHENLSRCFSDRTLNMDARFACSPDWTVLPDGLPALGNALAALGCRIESVSEVGSHSVFFARAEHLVLGDAERALIYFGRDYHHLPAPAKAA
jgi:flavin reductase